MKIFKSENINLSMNDNHFHFLPFEFENDKWVIVDKIKRSDIVPVLFAYENSIPEIAAEMKMLGHTNQTVLVLNLFHLMDNENNKIVNARYIELWQKYLNCPVLMVHSNLDEHADNCIFYDILWNRQKAYCTDYESFDLSGRAWSEYAGKKMYSLPCFEKHESSKIFLSPIRIYNDSNHIRMTYRSKLLNLIKNKNGYYSDNVNNIILESEEGIEFNQRLLSGGGTWWPVANRFYQSSYISVYVETILERDKLRSITEKTWDPLIKGHFILPFGYQGLIRDIVSYGFKLPSWIDYSYDSIEDIEQRWLKYSVEVERVLSWDISKIHQLWHDDLDILRYNREVFYTRKYDSLYDKVKDKLQKSA